MGGLRGEEEEGVAQGEEEVVQLPLIEAGNMRGKEFVMLHDSLLLLSYVSAGQEYVALRALDARLRHVMPLDTRPQAVHLLGGRCR